MKDTLEKVADTILDNHVTLTVTIEPKSRLDRILMRFGLKEKVKLLEIHPLNFGSMIKISRLLLNIDIEVLKSGNMLDAVYKIMDTKGDLIAKVLAVAIVNRKKDPPDELINFIKDNFTSQELLHALMIVLKQMDVTSFMSSIVSMRGINLLQETSQKIPEETIASGEHSEQQ